MTCSEIQSVLDGDSRWCVVTGDCLEVMKELPDNSVDAVVTDPPYGIKKAGGGGVATNAPVKYYNDSGWDDKRPDEMIFEMVLQISEKCCIWGGNYFADMLPASASWIVWDKDNGANPFADCELAWTNADGTLRKITHKWQGMLQEPGWKKELRVHPTQKPVRLMRWCIRHMRIEPGSVVFDPYCGSGTTGVAALQEGMRFIGVEIDEGYAEIARKRIANEDAQGKLFG